MKQINQPFREASQKQWVVWCQLVGETSYWWRLWKMDIVVKKDDRLVVFLDRIDSRYFAPRLHAIPDLFDRVLIRISGLFSHFLALL